VLAFIWAATERTDWKLGFQPQLERPWFELIGWPSLSAASILLVVLRR
jgi:type IV secretion system protein VirD4